MTMIKYSSPDDWDFGHDPMTPIKLSSRGLIGNDRAEFLKVASHIFADQLDNFIVKKGEHPVHLTALGADEYWGLNRNGDGFTEKECQACHPTFVKIAKVFRSHRNKSEKGHNHYGRVKFASYHPTMHRIELLQVLFTNKEAAEADGPLAKVADEEMRLIEKNGGYPVSMACALAGTLVKTTQGFLPIEQIRPGRAVLTHQGRYQWVTHVAKRKRQQYVKIGTRYCGRQTLEFTPDHEFFVARWVDLSDVVAGRTTQHVKSGLSTCSKAKYRKQLHTVARWLPCGDLQPGDFLLMPIPRGSGDSLLTVPQARQMGYYMAEGSITDDGYPCYTCNWADELVTESETLFDKTVTTYQHSGSKEACNLIVSDKNLADSLSATIGRGVRQKSIPQMVYNAPANIKLEFLATWLSGDGWQDVKGIHWSTCSRGLSIEIQMLLASVGIPSSVYRIDHTSDLPHGVKRKTVGIEYTVNVSNWYSPTFVNRSEKVSVVEMETTKSTAFITGDYLAIPVKSVDIVEDEVEVYDLTVEEDHSFTAFGLAVHNCKVARDTCNFCKHASRTRDEYCTEDTCKAGGCKKHLSHLVKVGNDVHHLGVLNPNPIWFDISRVGRPADRTALAASADYLTKAGSCDYDVDVRNASLPSHMLDIDGDDAWQIPQRELAYKLAAMQPDVLSELAVALTAGDASALLRWVSPPGTEKFAADLAALADQQIILPFEAFVMLRGGQEIAKQASSYLPGIYRRLVEDDEFESVLGDHGYRLRGCRVTEKQAQNASRSVADFSMQWDRVAARASIASIDECTCTARQRCEKVADDAAAVAVDYALYKLAALDRATVAATDRDTLLRLSYHQDYFVRS